MVTSTYPVAKSVCNSVVAAQLKSNPHTSAPFALVLTSIKKVVAVCRPIFSRKEETIESKREILAVENVWRGFPFSTVSFSFLEHRGHDIPLCMYSCTNDFAPLLCSSNHRLQKDCLHQTPITLPFVCVTHKWAINTARVTLGAHYFIHVKSCFTLLRGSSPCATKEQSIVTLFYRLKIACLTKTFMHCEGCRL